MKIIIVYASAGAGHSKSAQAIYEYFRKANPGLDLKLIDSLDYSSLVFKDDYAYGYTFMINHALWLWAVSFYITNVKFLRPAVNLLHFIFNRLNTHKLTKLFIAENPDFIISTHFLASEVAAYLKRGNKIKSRLVTVITDFGVHQFWLYKATDLYVAASGFTKQVLIGEGIAEEKIKILGIPVSPKFLLGHKPDELRERFRIGPEKFTVLIVTGSFGIGPIEKITGLLHGNDLEILVVCANNKDLFQRLTRKNYPDVQVFGFIDNVEELMAVSDVIITKPGGMTISELLMMELAPIFIHAIPGQEAQNVRAMQDYGIGLHPKDIKDIKNIILDYKSNPDKLNSIKDKIRQIKKPFGDQELYNVVCQGSIGPGC